MLSNVDFGTIHEYVEDGVRSAGIVAQLIRKPDTFGSRIIEICQTVVVLMPHEAEDKTVWFQVIHGPRLDVVELDQFKAVYPEAPCQCRKNTY